MYKKSKDYAHIIFLFFAKTELLDWKDIVGVEKNPFMFNTFII